MKSTNRYELKEIQSEEIQDVISKNPSWILNYGFFLVFFILSVLIIICWFVKYPNIIIADAVITFDPAPSKIESKVSGEVSLLMADNDSVKQGELIAYIKTDLKPVEVLNLEKAIESYLNEKKDNNQLTNVITTHAHTIESLNSSITQTISNSGINDNQQSINYEKQLSALIKKFFALKESNNNISSQFGSLNQFSDSLKVSNPDNLTDLYLRIANVENALIENEFKIDEFESQIANLEIKQNEHQKTLYSKSNETIKNLRNQISSWKETYLMIAPQDGIVRFQGIIQNDKYIESGPLLTVIPHEMDLVAYSEMSMNNIGKIKLGQTVNIQLKMYPSQDWGVVSGVVEAISQVPKHDHFQILIKLPNGIYTSYEKDIPFKLNMTGQAEFILDDKRLIERLAGSLVEIL